MRKILLIGLALGWATLPGVAAAQENPKRDCIIAETTPDLKLSLARSMIKEGEDPADEPLYHALGDVTVACVKLHGIAESDVVSYVEYSLASFLRDWTIGELGKLNLPFQPIDTALDFGPGRANPDISDGISDDQFALVTKAYSAMGIDIEARPVSDLEMVGAYIGASSKYWNQRAAISR